MKDFVKLYVTDVTGDTGRTTTWDHDFYDKSPEGVQAMTEAILLFPNVTARTNVCFKGADGKFISYREVHQDIAAAVDLLTPFPRG